MKKTALQKKLLVLFLAIGVAFTSLPLSGLVASADDTAALPKIWLDAGHGGSDPGAMNGDRHEADDNPVSYTHLERSRGRLRRPLFSQLSGPHRLPGICQTNSPRQRQKGG